MFESTLGQRQAAGQAAVEPFAIQHPSQARALFGRIVHAPATHPSEPAAVEESPGADPPEARPAVTARTRGHAPERPLFARLARHRAMEEEALPLGPAAAFAPADAPPPAFEALLRRDLAPRACRRVTWTALGAGVQATLVASVTALAAAMTEPPPKELPMVEVKLARAFPPRPGSPRAPGAPAAPAAVVRRASAPSAGRRPAVKPPPPTALLQPREIQVAMRAPAPGEPVEDWGGDEGAVAAADVDEGVVGGIPGGTGGGEWGAGATLAATDAAEPRGDAVEEAPQWVTAGFRKPVEAQPGCVARSVRLPRELAGFTSGPYTVRFAVLASGAVGRMELMGEVPDARILRAIQDAVHACRWVPGADAQGRPVALWVVLPIRFESA